MRLSSSHKGSWEKKIILLTNEEEEGEEEITTAIIGEGIFRQGQRKGERDGKRKGGNLEYVGKSKHAKNHKLLMHMKRRKTKMKTI